MNQTKTFTKKQRIEEELSGESPSDLLTINEVAEALRVDPTTARRWVKQGALDAVVLPHRGKRQAYRVKKATLDALLNPSTERKAS